MNIYDERKEINDEIDALLAHIEAVKHDQDPLQSFNRINTLKLCLGNLYVQLKHLHPDETCTQHYVRHTKHNERNR